MVFYMFKVCNNSEIIAFIYYCDFEISVQNARSFIAIKISEKVAFNYCNHISECEFLVLLFLLTCISRNNKKKITVISEFTVDVLFIIIYD